MNAVLALLALLSSVHADSLQCTTFQVGDVSSPLTPLQPDTLPPGYPDNQLTLPSYACSPLRHVGTLLKVCDDAPPTVLAYDLDHFYIHRNGNSYLSTGVILKSVKCAP